jgi:hypothetical protein
MLPMYSQLTTFMVTGTELMKVVLSRNSYRKRRRSTAMR